MLISEYKTDDDYFLLSNMDNQIADQVEEEFRSFDQTGEIFFELRIDHFPQKKAF